MTTRRKWLSFVLVVHMVVATLLSSATPIFAKAQKGLWADENGTSVAAEKEGIEDHARQKQEEREWKNWINQQNKNADWDRSSLSFIDQGKTTDGISATVKNGKDSEIMQGEVEYVVYRSDKGNPKNGEVIATGAIPALMPGEEAELTYSPDKLVNGNYKFKAYQRTNHPGTSELWSETITVTEGISPEESNETSEDKAYESTTEDTQTENSPSENTTESTTTEDTTDETSNYGYYNPYS